MITSAQKMTNQNLLAQKLKGYQLILGSGSPRRKLFLEQLGLEFEIRKKAVEEVYPEHLKGEEISRYLAELKAAPFQAELKENEILLTSDTVVWHKEESLAKASNAEEAARMLSTLSGDWHEVITSLRMKFTFILILTNPLTKRVPTVFKSGSGLLEFLKLKVRIPTWLACPHISFTKR